MTPRALNRLSMLAPVSALVVMLGMSHWLPNRVRLDDRAHQRRAEVAAALQRVPFFIGDWVGQDRAEDVPPEAQKLLRPNAIFSRRYQKPGGAWIHVLIVHCSDARDMIGHYPPICYPSSGWLSVPDAGPAVQPLAVGDRTMAVRQYEFRRARDRRDDDRIRIFSAFVLPDGTVALDISDINRQSERLALSVQGVAQLQLITAATMGRDEAAQAAGEVLGGMSDLLTALKVGQGATGDT